jgi:hypothetical protein
MERENKCIVLASRSCVRDRLHRSDERTPFSIGFAGSTLRWL